MRCAPSDSGQRTASGRAHDHAQPAWSPHRAQCRSTSGVQLPSMRCVRGNAGHAQVAGFVARLCSISTRQLARLPPASSRVVANAVEPNSSGTEALSSEADEVWTALHDSASEGCHLTLYVLASVILHCSNNSKYQVHLSHVQLGLTNCIHVDPR